MSRRRNPIADWDVEWSGINTHIADKTRGQAKSIVYGRIREIGYRAAFTDLRARRCIGLSGTVWCRVARNP